AADIVVIVETENARIRAPGAIKMRRGEPADAATHDDQIIIFTGRRDCARMRPEISVAQRVRDLETARMVATQPGQRRGIIARRIRRRRFSRNSRIDNAWQKGAGRRATNGNCNTVEKIAARDPVARGHKRAAMIVLVSAHASSLHRPRSTRCRKAATLRTQRRLNKDRCLRGSPGPSMRMSL